MADDLCQRQLQRAVHGYDQGVYTFLEMFYQILDCIDLFNVGDVVQQIPHEFAFRLRLEADAAPHTEDEWDDLGLIDIRNKCLHPGRERNTERERLDLTETNKREYRKKIEAIRKYFAERQK